MLVDTSVWVDHLRRGSRALTEALEAGQVETHAFVIGELACGNLHERNRIVSLLSDLPRVPVAEHGEVMAFIDAHELYGRGLGWIDMHLLASAALAAAPLWSLDRRLDTVAATLNPTMR